jgi:hypothetical protein
MDLPRMLVSVYHTTLGQSALLVLDLNTDTYQTLLPYPAPVCATEDHLYVAQFQGDRTRLEKYDRDGLVWLRRLRDCVDTHSVALLGEQIAVTSTGTNEVIFLDPDGREQRRWSPDPAAEGDSWHLNSLTCRDGRLLATCFGRFSHFRSWCGHVTGAGLLMDIESNRPVLEGLSGPHDPHRVENGWVVNESDKSRTVFIPDDGPTQVIHAAPGFPRGLAILPDVYVLGVSSPRDRARPQGCASVLVIDRKTHEVRKSINLPWPEIGHIVVAPRPEVLTAVQREQAAGRPCFLPQREAIPAADRVGSITALGTPRVVHHQPELFELHIRVTNRSGRTWSSGNEIPIYVAFQVLNAEGNVLFPEGSRNGLPVPLTPGKTLTFPIYLDLTICYHLPAAAALRVTMVQESVEWWQPSDVWSPAFVPLRLPPLPGTEPRPEKRRSRWWKPILGREESHRHDTPNRAPAPF